MADQTLLEQVQKSQEEAKPNFLLGILQDLSNMNQAFGGNIAPLQAQKKQEIAQQQAVQFAEQSEGLQGPMRDKVADFLKRGKVGEAKKAIAGENLRQSLLPLGQDLPSKRKKAFEESLAAGKSDVAFKILGLEKQRRVKEQKKESQAIIAPLISDLPAEAQIQVRSALAEDRTEEARRLIREARAKPTSVTGLLQAGSRNEVDLEDSASRIQYLQAQGASLAKAEAISGQFESRFVKSKGLLGFFGIGETVQVSLPDGRVGAIPKARLNEAIAAGATLVKQPVQ